MAPKVKSRGPTPKAPEGTRRKVQTQSKPGASTKKDAGQSAAGQIESPSKKQKTMQRDPFDALLEPEYKGKKMTDPINTAEDKWNLLPAFLKVKGLVKQHIDSFNYFVEVELRNIVNANQFVRSEVNREFWFKYTNIYVGEPNRQEEEGHFNSGATETTVSPNECRLRDMTYAAPIYVDFDYLRQDTGQTARVKRQPLGRLPIMLRSSKCHLTNKTEAQQAAQKECTVDPGGYFIVKGQEKVILVQEQLSKNRVIVEAAKGIVQASVTSSTHQRKSKSYVLLKKNNRLYFKHNILKEDVPICIIFKAMGVQSDEEILALVAGHDEVYQDEFIVNFEELPKAGVSTQTQALEYIGSHLKIERSFGKQQDRDMRKEAVEYLVSVMITHVPVINLNFRPKILYVAHMVRRVLMAMHDPKLVDDRDYVGNKRLELAGQMLSLLFEDNFKKFNHDFKMYIDKTLGKRNRLSFDAADYFKGHSSHITGGLERAIATGNWHLKRFKMDRAGVTHLLSRLSYISALGMMTRISSQFEKTRKVSGPRALQTSQFGMLCPSDTPEGESCGLVKNLALMTHITTEDREEPVKELIFMLGAEDANSASGGEMYHDGAYIIFVNGTPTGLTSRPRSFLNAFRRFRRMGRISEFISVHINDDHSAVHIATDEGRICRPLIIVENGRSKVTQRYIKALLSGNMDFDDFLSRGLVEYVDVNEENDSNIAVYERDINNSTTHLEIEPFTILGAVAGLIPYPHHNQSPRNTYQCAMGKQAIGAIAYNQLTRLDTLLYLMVYPQKPLCKTRTIELIKYDQLPAGQNATVAVMSYSGYDIEDALVINRASCDRGFGRCQVFKKLTTQLKTHPNGLSDELGEREEGKASHRQIGTDGLIEVGARIEKDDAWMIKGTPVNTSSSGMSGDSHAANGYDYKDEDLCYRLPDHSLIDRVMLTQNEQQTAIIKVQTRQTRRPEVGDKFSSRHGQKGVVGIIVPQEDLPFSDEGVTPDIIMNPHGFPSRMTVGKMLELVAGKSGILTGNFEYGTAFGGSDVEVMGKNLVDRGFSYSGKDFLNCGITGEALPAYVFTGPIYYQKLKHMVQDKMHSRATGPKAILTRQPTEGRSRAGGLRLGEMERDCLIAYGASQLLLERLMLSSDAHECDICEKCGMMGFHGWCQTCKSSKGVVTMTIPYAAKLLIQELLSMNIKASLKLEDEFQ